MRAMLGMLGLYGKRGVPDPLPYAHVVAGLSKTIIFIRSQIQRPSRFAYR